MRLFAAILTLVCLAAGCTTSEKGTTVVSSEPPHDVWQLTQRAVSLVPLTVDKPESLLSTPMVEDPQTPGRWNGGPVRLSDTLEVSSASIGIKPGSWNFAAFHIRSTSCITIDMLKEHYPSIELTYGATGHSVYEEFGWSVSYPWGELTSGMRVKDDCLTGIGLVPSSELK